MTKRLFLIIALLLSAGCAGMLTDNLSGAILDHDDPTTVGDAIPAYLIVMDSLIRGDDDDEDYLQTGASLYAAYAGLFVDDKDRSRRLAERAFDYGKRAVCENDDELCNVQEKPFAQYTAALDRVDDEDDLEYLGALAQSWLIWIRTHSDDWNAVADLPRVEALLQTILRLDEGWNDGSAHVYMGVLLTLRPPALGGKPDEAKQHFERAIELSGGSNLGAKVAYAENYARMVFDRDLHDRLLKEVIAADPHAEGETLLNVLAQRHARDLLASADDYF